MTEFKQYKDDPLAQLRANQAVLAARITEIEAALCLGAETTAECCGRGPACGACDPEPVPQWRALVDEHDGSNTPFGPLAEVLGCLHSLAASANAGDEVHEGIGWNLARIVAVAEAQVGDGWQAEPSAIFGACMSVRALIKEGWTADGHPRWQGLGNAASAWLRDLTDGAQ